MNGTQLRTVIGEVGDIGAPTHRGANVWRGSLQTLLVDAMCGGALGLLPGLARFYPGSPRLGSADPGLNYAAPLGLVWGGVEWRKMSLTVLRQNILVDCKAEAEGLTMEKAIGRLLKMVKGEMRRLK